MEPIEIVGYDPQWPAQFDEIAGRVRVAFADGPLIAVEHVGSTSVIGMAAKPIIDLNVIVSSQEDISEAIERLATLGYVHQGDLGIPGHLFFRKGLVQYRRTHHLHMVETSHEQWTMMLTFRDYLRAHSDEAQHYEALKQGLAVQFRDNRQAYTDGKEEFVKAILEKARNTNG